MTKYYPFIVSTLIGATSWLGIGELSGIEDAWDSTLYWKIGLPAMAVTVFFVAFFWPVKPWRWAITIVVIQAVIGLIQAFPHINLWSLSLVMFGLISLPLVVSAYVGSLVKRKVVRF